MYIILSDAEGSNVGLYCASELKIAEAVKVDLDNKLDAKMVIDELDSQIFTFDPGGMLMTNDEDFDFDLGSFTLSCKAQHFGYLTDAVLGAVPTDVNGVKYIMLHGYMWCMCISKEEFNLLKQQIADPDLTMKSNKSIEDRARRLRSLYNSGIIANRNDYGEYTINKSVSKKLN